MIRSALETMPPAAITISRLWLGAIVLYAIMRHAGRRLPPLMVWARGKLRLRRSWGWMIVVGIVGNTLPFFIFPWAQQFVDSGRAWRISNRRQRRPHHHGDPPRRGGVYGADQLFHTHMGGCDGRCHLS